MGALKNATQKGSMLRLTIAAKSGFRDARDGLRNAKKPVTKFILNSEMKMYHEVLNAIDAHNDRLREQS